MSHANREGVYYSTSNLNESVTVGRQDTDYNSKEYVSPDSFRQLMFRFLTTFTPDGGRSFPYKEMIVGLRETNQQQNRQTANSSITSFTVDLSQIVQYSCWDVLGENTDDIASEVASTLVDTAEIPHHMLLADNVYACITKQPLRYLPIMETLIVHIFKYLTQEEVNVFQLDLADRNMKPISLRNLQAQHVDRLILIPGIIIGMTKVTMKAVNIRARCRKCENVIFLKVAQWQGAVPLPKNCPSNERARDSGQRCPPNSYEVVCEWSEYIETQLSKFQELPEDVPIGEMPRNITLSLAGIHARSVIPGQRVYVCGVFSNFDNDVKSNIRQNKKKSSYIHVMGTFVHPEEKSVAKALFGGVGDQMGTSFNETEINSIREISKLPDVIEVIGRSIAPGIYGMEKVKLSIACLLLGGSRKSITDGTKLRGDIHILLLGDPSVAKSQLLKYSCQVSRRGVYTSGKGTSAAGLTAAIVKDSQGNFALEGGAMVLGDGGIVAIDEFDKMRDDDRVAIHEAMEQQTISIAKAGINTVLNSQCSVLAAANPSFGSFDTTIDTADQHDFETTILSRFDLIWPIYDDKDFDKDKRIASHIFGLYTNDSDKMNVDEESTGDVVLDKDGQKILNIEFLKKYIAYARERIHPRLNASAVNRLENYYVEIREKSRKVHQNRVDQVPITIRQLESLVRLSESFAKMCLSDLVLPHHVDLAIELFDNATIEASKSAICREQLTPEERDKVEDAESAILRRIAINARVSKFTISRDLQYQGVDVKYSNIALRKLIKEGRLLERKDASVMRIA